MHNHPDRTNFLFEIWRVFSKKCLTKLFEFLPKIGWDKSQPCLHFPQGLLQWSSRSMRYLEKASLSRQYKKTGTIIWILSFDNLFWQFWNYTFTEFRASCLLAIVVMFLFFVKQRSEVQDLSLTKNPSWNCFNVILMTKKTSL